MDHNSQEYLGVDVGAARVGIARGSSLARIAEPLKTVATKLAVAELKQLADSHQAAGIVVGLPRSLGGAETDQTKLVRQWVQLAKNQIQRNFYWQDEALTSKVAESQKPGQHGSDADAAAIILQDFLDAQEGDRVAV